MSRIVQRSFDLAAAADGARSPLSPRRSLGRDRDRDSPRPTTWAASRSTPTTRRRARALFRQRRRGRLGPGHVEQGSLHSSTSAPHTAAARTCYGSNIDKNPASRGVSTLICDGQLRLGFRNDGAGAERGQPGRQDARTTYGRSSPATSTPRTTSRTPTCTPRSVDSPCDTDPDADDVVLHLGGHVGDNEGSHFWGFEFMKNAPGGFHQPEGERRLVLHPRLQPPGRRHPGLLHGSGNSSDPVQLELFRVTGFVADGSAQLHVSVAALPGCPRDAPAAGLQRC